MLPTALENITYLLACLLTCLRLTEITFPLLLAVDPFLQLIIWMLSVSFYTRSNQTIPQNGSWSPDMCTATSQKFTCMNHNVYIRTLLLSWEDFKGTRIPMIIWRLRVGLPQDQIKSPRMEAGVLIYVQQHHKKEIPSMNRSVYIRTSVLSWEALKVTTISTTLSGNDLGVECLFYTRSNQIS